eukprot:c28248_g1_i2 orf=722-1537(-)
MGAATLNSMAPSLPFPFLSFPWLCTTQSCSAASIMAVLPLELPWLALNHAPSSPFSPLLSVSSFTQGIGSDLDVLVRRQTARMKGVGVGIKGTAVCHCPSVNLNSATNAASAEKTAFSTPDASEDPRQGLRVVIAGGGIGGLVLALALKRKGVDVNVLERDMTAIRGEGQYRGPIQIQSNALAALEAIDMDVADEVMANGCITGDRINGLVDGITGSWCVLVLAIQSFSLKKHGSQAQFHHHNRNRPGGKGRWKDINRFRNSANLSYTALQ